MDTPPLPPNLPELKQPPVVTKDTPSTYTIHIEEKSKYDWVSVIIDTTDGAKPGQRTVMAKSLAELLTKIVICTALRDTDRKQGDPEPPPHLTAPNSAN